MCAFDKSPGSEYKGVFSVTLFMFECVLICRGHRYLQPWKPSVILGGSSGFYFLSLEKEKKVLKVGVGKGERKAGERGRMEEKCWARRVHR